MPLDKVLHLTNKMLLKLLIYRGLADLSSNSLLNNFFDNKISKVSIMNEWRGSPTCLYNLPEPRI